MSLRGHRVSEQCDPRHCWGDEATVRPARLKGPRFYVVSEWP